MDKTFGLDAGRLGRLILSGGKCSLRTMAVDARINRQLYLKTLAEQGVESKVEVNSRKNHGS